MRRKKGKRTGINLIGTFPIILAAVTVFPALSQREAPAVDPSSAPATSRSIEGTVLSETGSPVAGAVVLIKDSKTLQVRSYLAQQDGKYHFYGLSTEVNYQLRAQANGLTSKSKTVSVFDSHAKVVLNLKLTKKRTKSSNEAQ